MSVTRADGSLTATWPAVSGATSYHITYSSDGEQSWSLAALNHPDASITVGGLDNAATYVVGVRARNSGGDSGWRNSDPAGPFTPPDPTPTPEPTETPTPTPTPEPTESTGEVAGAAGQDGANAQSGLSWVTSPPTLLEWTQGVAVNVTLPAATGDPNITYVLSDGGGNKAPKLPPGISWNAGTRTLSGTPTKWFSTRVSNYDASAPNKSTPDVNIRIRVADTSGNHAPYADIKSSGVQLLGQSWSKYGA